MIAVDRPVSLRPRNDPRYRVADSYLRFWLRFIGPSLPDIARGRPDLALSGYVTGGRNTAAGPSSRWSGSHWSGSLRPTRCSPEPG